MKLKFALIFVYIFVSVSFGQIIKDQLTSQMQNQSMFNFQGNQSNKINADISDILNINQYQQTGLYNQIMPIEGAVDLDRYIIGPNDVFQLAIFGLINQQIPLIVNPEGSVIIPSVGEIKVSGSTLAKAKEDVIDKVKKRYKAEVSFNLITPRTFIVNVAGLVQGKYQATSLTRASEMLKYVALDTLNITRRYFETMSKDRVENNLLRTDISLRNIKLIRKDGSVHNVDLYKYFMTNDDKYNPYLLEGDLLKIPNTLLSTNYVSIFGAVQLAGFYEYGEEDDLETLVGLGRGLDSHANPDSITLFRPLGDNSGFQVFHLSLTKDKNFKIKVFDRAFVNYRFDYEKMSTVLILGEINMPGYYPITYKKTKLRELIDMAGGLKTTAFLPLSILFRYWDAEYRMQDSTDVFIQERANDVIITETDKQNFLTDIKARRNRVLVDFVKLVEKNDESQNVILEDKDIIYINDNKNAVYVYGQVNNEGYVAYKEGADALYYIEKAGGYGLAADENETRIIKFNSRGYYRINDINVENGDFIYVPKKDKKTFSEIVGLVAQIASVILGVLTTYILIKNTQ
jgi:protein involved in polysaccharide export with SLBB domain